jgi:hypothetical protein
MSLANRLCAEIEEKKIVFLCIQELRLTQRIFFFVELRLHSFTVYVMIHSHTKVAMHNEIV